MDLEDLRRLPLFEKLTDDQLRELLAEGDVVDITPGADLFVEGEPAVHWWVLVDGAVDLLRRTGPREEVVAQMNVPGRWAGGFVAWDEGGVYLATGRGVTPGRTLRVPAGRLRALTDTWFPLGGHLIAGLFHTARSIESTARQHGSLLTLGTLAAGLAHELNNPASAASRSVDAVQDAGAAVLASLRALAAAGLAADRFVALDELRAELQAPSVPLSPLVRADREQDVATWLARHAVPDEWVLAARLVAAGADVAWCDRVATDVPAPVLAPGLAWVAHTQEVASLLAETKESVHRISELVTAVRSYSQVDRATTRDVDVVEGIESTLVVLGHKLHDGVTVVRDYGTTGQLIEAYPGELNQVWTNLIDNALDAMAGSGELRIGTRVDGDDVVVEVADTGPGMSAEVAARAFEAFFTTKDVGKGSGLGLDIARRVVVERHTGSIEVDSRPGCTVMRVRLPIRRPAS